jgi:hypothetical protein
MMPKIALVVFFFVTSFASNLQGVSITDHGLGFLQRVRNNSEYAISFAQSKTILDYLPDDTKIRIKSLRKEYGVSGRYYAVRKLVGAYRLQADTIDPEDIATHLTIKRFVARDFTEYIGIYSDVAQGQFMKSDDSRAITFSMPDMMDDKLAEGHWTIVDANGDSGAIDSKKFLDPQYAANVFNNCFLKSRTSGFMQSRGKPQNYPGVNTPPKSKYSNPILAGTDTSTPATPPASADGKTDSTAQKPDGSTAPVGPVSSPTASGKVETISQEKCSYVGNSNTVVAINKNGMAMSQKADGSWENLDQGLNGAELTSLGAATDGTIWSCDVNNNVWSYDSSAKTWKKILLAPSTGVITKVALASSSQIWVLSKDGTIFQKSGSDSNTIWQPPAAPFGTGIVNDFCISPDGTIFAICSDYTIYKGTGSGSSYTFSQFASPSTLLKVPPYNITAGSSSFVAFTTPSGEVYVLVEGKSGNTSDSWKKLLDATAKTGIKLRSIAASKNKSLVGVVSNSGQPNDNTVVQISDITTA